MPFVKRGDMLEGMKEVMEDLDFFSRNKRDKGAMNNYYYSSLYRTYILQITSLIALAKAFISGLVGATPDLNSVVGEESNVIELSFLFTFIPIPAL